MKVVRNLILRLRQHRLNAHSNLRAAVLAGNSHEALKHAIIEEYVGSIAGFVVGLVREEEGESAADELHRLWIEGNRD